MNLNEFKANMLLMGWDMKVLPLVEGETKESLLWSRGDDKLWWRSDAGGRYSFLHAPSQELVMITYYTFEKILEILDEQA